VSESGRVIIVTGPPGSGKTAVARSLADGDDRSAHVESDWFFRFLRSGFIPPFEPASAEQNTVVMDIACDAVAAYAHAGYNAYWDGIVGPWFLDRVLARLAAADLDVSYVVLRPEREVALSRVHVRDGEADSSGAATMYHKFRDVGQWEPHVVRSDGSVDEVVGTVRRRLRDGSLTVARVEP
jgi:cytidylate kinase